MTTRLSESERPFRLESRDDGLRILWIDDPERSVNTLRRGFDRHLHDLLDSLDQDGGARALVVASAKEESFVVGADLEMFDELESVEEATALALSAQKVLHRLAEDLDLPVVAAIDGQCVGGGLEVALACSSRVASSSTQTRLGLPEVKLGLVPGAGGTQRLPRLVGLEEALDLILTGKRIPAERALRIGLVDEVVHPAILLDVALERARRLADEAEAEESLVERTQEALEEAMPRDLKALLLEDNPAGRRVLFSQAKKRTLAKTKGNMPAPLRALEAVRTGIEEGMEAGFRAEAEAFGELAMSEEAEHLIFLFFARQELDAETGVADDDVEPRSIDKVGILGAGLMGSGIAQVSAAEAGVTVRLKDAAEEPLRDGVRRIHRNLAASRLGHRERERTLARIRPTVDYTGFGRAGLVIEAVVEDLEIKHRVLGEVEEAAARDFIFASNTSSIPIGDIAEAAGDPSRVIGMHYFSPVEKVPLLEVVTTDETAPWVVATCVEFGKRQGKTVIVVNDGTGFYTSRILVPYINEALDLLTTGVPVDTIDDALADFGFPVGPLKLLDEVGIDVAEKIGRIAHEAFGERMEPAEIQAALVEDDRRGRKNGRGFYRYERDGREWQSTGDVDESLYDSLDIEVGELGKGPSAEEIARRCALAMVNEAAHCYDEGILRSARDGDVGAVFGLGFPPFLGGPFHWLDGRGLERTLGELRELAETTGGRFEPARSIARLAEGGLRFYDETTPPPGADLDETRSTRPPAEEEST